VKLVALAFVLTSCAIAPLEMKDFTCPPQGTTLTYASFGRAFIDTSCNTCHATDAPTRHGAPESFHFETLDDIRRHADRIFVRAAATNTSMPPGPNDPSPEDRDKLAEWLACGAP
jgi:uncharacterized membrane protein